MKKYSRNLSIVFIFLIIWVLTDLDYDAKDQDSINRMMKWSPFSMTRCLNSFEVAADNHRGTNLHGLNCPQIYQKALNKTKTHYENSVKLLTNAADSLDKSPNSKVMIYFKPFSGIDASIHSSNSPSVERRIYTSTEIKNHLADAKESYLKIAKETDRIIPNFPWSEKINIRKISHTPFRFEIITDPDKKELTNSQELKSAALNEANVSSKAMMGDSIDTNPGAKPNTREDAFQKSSGKSWQDENGYIHFPDGSVTNTPVD